MLEMTASGGTPQGAALQNQFLFPPKDKKFFARNEEKSNGALTRISRISAN
jgi:hypothetical protein